MLIALVILAVAVLALGAGILAVYRLLCIVRKELHAADAAPPPAPPASPPAPDNTAASRQIVHDLANLLGTVHGFTDAAVEDLPRNNPIRSDLLEVLDASDRAQKLLKQWRSSLHGAQEAETAEQKSLARGDTAGAGPSETAENVNRILDYAEAEAAATAAAPQKPNARPSKNGSRPPGRGEHLLIVDDEHQLLTMFRRIFEPQGYRITTFSNGLMAWDDFQKHSDLYDLAILDQRMPEMSGTSLAIEMLNCRPDFPIILLSGYSESIRPDDAARIGIRHFLSKPIPQAELSETIRKTLDESHLFHA